MKIPAQKTLAVVLTLGLAAWILPGQLRAQAYRGAIEGEVMDGQKASVPGASITLKNESTGAVETSASAASGQFGFRELAPGVYTITSEAKGFTTFVQRHVAVNVGRTVPLTVVMQLGQVTQTVTVNANPATADSRTSDIGTVATPREIQDLPVPLSGDMRNPLSFVIFTPGVNGSAPGAAPDFRLHISGASSFSNEVYVDGIPVAETNLSGNIGRNHPPIDAISEFKIINNNPSARYGLASGIVSFAFKWGTNDYHGSLFEYLQNDALNAAGFVTNALGQKKAPLKQNEYGGAFGGPVRIPKLYKAHNKTFFKERCAKRSGIVRGESCAAVTLRSVNSNSSLTLWL